MKKKRSINMRYWTPKENQYMVLQLVYWVNTPESSRAIKIPRSKPDTTMDRAVARRWAGAKSPTRGSISWGVTVVTAVMKERARKTPNDLVTHKPSHWKSQPVNRPMWRAENYTLSLLCKISERGQKLSAELCHPADTRIEDQQRNLLASP